MKSRFSRFFVFAMLVFFMAFVSPSAEAYEGGGGGFMETTIAVAMAAQVPDCMACVGDEAIFVPIAADMMEGPYGDPGGSAVRADSFEAVPNLYEIGSIAKDNKDTIKDPGGGATAILKEANEVDTGEVKEPFSIAEPITAVNIRGVKGALDIRTGLQKALMYVDILLI